MFAKHITCRIFNVHKLDTVLENKSLLIPSVVILVFGDKVVDSVDLKVIGRRSEKKQKQKQNENQSNQRQFVINAFRWKNLPWELDFPCVSFRTTNTTPATITNVTSTKVDIIMVAHLLEQAEILWVTVFLELHLQVHDVGGGCRGIKRYFVD